VAKQNLHTNALWLESHSFTIFTGNQLDGESSIGDDSRMQISFIAFVAVSISLVPSFFAPVPAKRPIAIDDMYRIREVGDPQCSPDGNWIAYTVTDIDRDADKRRTSIWMVNWEGTQSLRLSYGLDSDTTPR
jgi:hypothetical protein